ncbi:MAG: hypothetical protein JWQ71_2024, partial [Pedosphaera sp.]|nr:hypothetical protein [Pedosphaera sp.]
SRNIFTICSGLYFLPFMVWPSFCGKPNSSASPLFWGQVKMTDDVHRNLISSTVTMTPEELKVAELKANPVKTYKPAPTGVKDPLNR